MTCDSNQTRAHEHRLRVSASTADTPQAADPRPRSKMVTRMQDFHAIIIGAGVAGLSTAYWLGKVGWRVTVLECLPSIAPGGQPLFISGAGLETLRRMDLKDLRTTPHMHSHSVIRDSRGKEILRIPFAEAHRGVDIVATCKGDLARAIAAALPSNVTVRFDAIIDATQDHPDMQAEVELKGGEIIEGDLIIAADGALSDVRGQYWEDEKWAELLGCYYATYQVDMDHGLDSYVQSYSAGGHIDVLTAPAADRVAALHIWRVDHTKEPEATDMKYDVIRRVTSKKNKKVWEVLHAAERAANAPKLHQGFMVVLDEWRRARILLVGDAAHCFGPWSSQGAGISMASAEVLAQEMVACGKAGSTLSNVFARWEARVRPTVEKLQMRVRAAVPKLLPKNAPVYKARMWFTRALGEEHVVAWQALGTKNEIEMAKLPPIAPILASERRVMEGEGNVGGKASEEETEETGAEKKAEERQKAEETKLEDKAEGEGKVEETKLEDKAEGGGKVEEIKP